MVHLSSTALQALNNLQYEINNAKNSEKLIKIFDRYFDVTNYQSFSGYNNTPGVKEILFQKYVVNYITESSLYNDNVKNHILRSIDNQIKKIDRYARRGGRTVGPASQEQKEYLFSFYEKMKEDYINNNVNNNIKLEHIYKNIKLER